MLTRGFHISGRTSSHFYTTKGIQDISMAGQWLRAEGQSRSLAKGKPRGLAGDTANDQRQHQQPTRQQHGLGAARLSAGTRPGVDGAAGRSIG